MTEPREDDARRQPGPVGRQNDDETDRTDLDMDEPDEGFGVTPWTSRDVTRDEALRLLGGTDATDVPPDSTTPPAEAEGGTEEVR
jgi:hypothetical protein